MSQSAKLEKTVKGASSLDNLKNNAKFDAYLQAGIQSKFAEYEIDADKLTVSIGFSVVSGLGGTGQSAHDELVDVFKSDSNSRLSLAHAEVLKTPGASSAYLTADVSFKLLGVLAAHALVTEIQLCSGLRTERLPARIPSNQADSSPSQAITQSKSSLILAVIDHGCPFAHSGFLKDGQTTIHSIWDQDSVPEFPVADGITPIGFDYGRVINRDPLNGYIASATQAGRLDEDACYQAAQYRATQARFTHGSATLGLLASGVYSPSLSKDGRASEMPPLDADVIFVQLPRNVPLTPARGSIERCTLDGIRYILSSARNNSRVAVVVDYGTEMGPHDGSSWFERALDALVAEALVRSVKLDVVFPTGNSHEAKRQAVIDLSRVTVNQSVELQWAVPRANEAALTLEIWCKAEEALFDVSILAPDQSEAAFVFEPTDGIRHWDQDGKTLAVAVRKTQSGSCSITLQIAATHPGQSLLAAPSGVWRIKFTPKEAGCALVHAYTCWAGRNAGMPQRMWPGKFRAEAALLENGTVRIDGNGSLIGTACGASNILVGGYERWGRLQRSAYSSGGVARGGSRLSNATGADYLAATEESPSLRGLSCQGSRSGTRVRMIGTSFAAPQIARNLLSGALIACPPAASPTPSDSVAKQRADYGEVRIEGL